VRRRRGERRPAGLVLGPQVEGRGERLGDVGQLAELEGDAALGFSVEEVHRRAYAGEYPPTKPMDLRVLM